MKRISSTMVLTVSMTTLVVGFFGFLVWDNNRLKAAAPITLTQGTTVGQTYFHDGDTSKGGHGQIIDGIEPLSQEQSVYHIHAHLSIFVNGKQIAVPKGIGIIPPWQVEQNFVGSGQGFYLLHTHDATGIIHIEAPKQTEPTLGQFFDIWGEPLSSTNVANFKGGVTVLIDGKQLKGDPRNITLTDHEQITLEVGQPVVTPRAYAFPPETP